MDQPHQDDGEEVELLAQDARSPASGPWRRRASFSVLTWAKMNDSILSPLDGHRCGPQVPGGVAVVLSSGARTGQCRVEATISRRKHVPSGTYGEVGSATWLGAAISPRCSSGYGSRARRCTRSSAPVGSSVGPDARPRRHRRAASPRRRAATPASSTSATGTRLRIRAASRVYAHVVGKVEFGLDEGLTGWVARTGEPAFIREEALSDPRMKYVPELEEERFQSMVAVPVPARSGEVLGVVVLHTVAPREFDEGVLNFLVHTASLVAGAIENARLYEESRARVDALTNLAQLSERIARGQRPRRALPGGHTRRAPPAGMRRVPAARCATATTGGPSSWPPTRRSELPEPARGVPRPAARRSPRARGAHRGATQGVRTFPAAAPGAAAGRRQPDRPRAAQRRAHRAPDRGEPGPRALRGARRRCARRRRGPRAGRRLRPRPPARVHPRPAAGSRRRRPPVVRRRRARRGAAAQPRGGALVDAGTRRAARPAPAAGQGAQRGDVARAARAWA